VEIARILAQGAGSIHGFDSSAAMIAAAKTSAESAGLADKCTFEGLYTQPCPLPLPIPKLTQLTFSPLN
jgi:tRNA/tmRNA/rRNA uracil-C5-methylase (TrmA/RlmC/RlmD family)